MLHVFGSSIWDRPAFVAQLQAALESSGLASRAALIDTVDAWVRARFNTVQSLVGSDRLSSGQVPVGSVDWTSADAMAISAAQTELERRIVTASNEGRHVVIIGSAMNDESDIPALARHLFYVKSDAARGCLAYNSRVRAAMSAVASTLAALESDPARMDPRAYELVVAAAAGAGPRVQWPMTLEDGAGDEASSAILANERRAVVEGTERTVAALVSHIGAEPAPLIDMTSLRETAATRKMLSHIVTILRMLGTGWYFEDFNAAADALLAKPDVTMNDFVSSPLARMLHVLCNRWC